MKGYTTKVARIDLATGKITREELTEEFCKNWIGGYGMGIKVQWDEVPAGCDPLSPKNVLVFNSGHATLKYRDLGTPINSLNFQKLGILPTKNFQNSIFNKAVDISGETMAEKWTTKKAACSQCPIGCDHLVYIKEGPFKGAIALVDFEPLFAVGSCCCVNDMAAITKAIELETGTPLIEFLVA